MHIVHLYDGHEQVYQGRGSVPQVVWNLAREGVAGGNEVTVIERQWNDTENYAVHEGVIFKRLKLRTGANEPWTQVPYEQVRSTFGIGQLILDRTNFAVAALKKLRKLSFDILHVHLPFAANILLTLAPWLRNKTVFTAHLGELRLNALTNNEENTGSGGSSIKTPAILSAFSPDVYLAKRAAHTTVLNSGILDAFVERGIPRDTLSTLPNGIVVDRFNDVSEEQIEQIRMKYKLDNRPIILFVGTVMPRKGVIDLVQAVGNLYNNQKLLDFELAIAGDVDLDNKYVEKVEQATSELGIKKQTSMLGFVPSEDLPALYAAADVFVVPSLEEGFGMTAVEALAAGTLVAGTRVGALSEIVTKDEFGKLSDAGDPEGLATAIDQILHEEIGKDYISEAAKNQVMEYSWESIGKKCLQLYQDITDER